MDEIEWWEFDSVRELAEQAGGDIGFVIERAVEAHGSARLALAAGSGAEEVLTTVAADEADWSKVTLMPTDDLLVELDSAESGFARLQRTFGARGADVVSLVDEAALGDVREAGRLADARLNMLAWPLDLVLLQVDDDGQVAGLLPGPDLDAALTGPRQRRALGVRGDAGERVTLTAAALSSARALMILVRGAAAREALEQGIKEGPLSSRPVGRLLAEIEMPVDIFWTAA